MNHIRAFNIIAAPILFLGVTLQTGDAAAQSAKSLVGSWTIVKVGDSYGSSPKGMLIFDASGHYSLTITRSDLPKFASDSRVKGTAEENKAVVAGSITHFGRYSVNQADKALTFNIEGSTYPNWNGTVQKRPFKIVKDELTYTVATPSAGGAGNDVIWRRLK